MQNQIVIQIKTPFRYDIDIQANSRNLNKERCLWALKHKAQRIQSGSVNIISSFRRNSDGNSFLIIFVQV